MSTVNFVGYTFDFNQFDNYTIYNRNGLVTSEIDIFSTPPPSQSRTRTFNEIENILDFNTYLIDHYNINCYNYPNLIDTIIRLSDIYSDEIIDLDEWDNVPDESFWEPVKTKLTKDEFTNNLVHKKMNNLLKHEYNIEDISCVVCLDDIQSNCKCTVLSCGHIYHTRCIETWLTETCTTPTCPSCRVDVR